MFAYCNNNPVNYIDRNGEGPILIAFIVAVVVTGVANAISTAMSGGSAEECLVAGLIGSGSAAVGFGIAFLAGFSPAGNLAGRAVASAFSDLGTKWYSNGEITGEDVATTAVDVTIDVCFSAITYYYTDPIKSFVRQTFVNSCIDAGVDILETKLFGTQAPITSNGNISESRLSPFSGGYSYAKYIAFGQ